MQSEPILFNLVFQINGKSTDCGVKKSNTGNEDSYTVCTHIDGEHKEFPLGYNAATRFFFFTDVNMPQDLKSAEATISKAIHAQAKSDLLDFMSNPNQNDIEEIE